MTQLQQTEVQFQQAVIDYARLMGWKVYHTHDSSRSESGFPDLVLARKGRIVFAELKTQNGRVKAEQQEWLIELNGREEFGLDDYRVKIAALMRNEIPRVLVCLWRPDCWDEIQAVLR